MPSNTFPRALVSLACLAAIGAGSALAIDPYRAMSQYVRDAWGAEKGFPRGAVYAIAQSVDGYLWIGTETGLLRFDGIQFQPVLDPSGKFKFTNVVGLVADADGSLWLRLRNMTLLHYRNGSFEGMAPKPEAATNITAIQRSKSGGLLAAKRQLGSFTATGESLHLAAAATGVPRTPIMAVAQSGDGTYWLGSRAAGLFRLADGKTTVVSKGLPDLKINCLLAEGAQGLWIGTDHGVAHWNGLDFDSKAVAESAGAGQVLSLAQDRDANLWVGMDSGKLLRLNPAGGSRRVSDSLDLGSAVMALFEDREGNLWIGRANGIERLRDSPFVAYSTPEGLPTDGANPVFADEKQRTWFSPASGGLRWLGSGAQGRVNDPGLDKDIVYSIAGGPNQLWLGRQRGGLTRIDLKPTPTVAQTYTRRDGLAQDSVYSVHRDRSGAVWAGTLGGGISKLENGRFTTYTMADGLPSNTIAAIAEGADGTMYFATPGGLSALSEGRWKIFRSDDGLPSDNVLSLIEDSAGVLWAGTGKGIASRSGDKFAAPGGAPESLREAILGMAEDRAGSL